MWGSYQPSLLNIGGSAEIIHGGTYDVFLKQWKLKKMLHDLTVPMRRKPQQHQTDLNDKVKKNNTTGMV